MNELSDTKLIHEYLGGELSPAEEERLFEQLSSSPSLREELAVQMKMHESVQKDLGQVTIPSETTTAIFSSVGLQTPKPLSASIASKSAYLNIGGMYGFIAGVCIVVVASIAAYVLVRSSSQGADRAAHVAVRSAQSADADTNPTVGNISSDLHSVNKTGANSESALYNSSTRSEVRTSTDFSSKNSTNERVHPNEPIKFYFDVDKFSSVDYLTQSKIIGVTDEGKIYCSEDGGTSWILQNTSTKNDLFGVNFFDTARGVVVGAGGIILRTTNAGRKWEPVSSGTTANLATVRYATEDTIYACGTSGTILRSSSGGAVWQRLQSGTSVNLFKIIFTGGADGFVSGEHGITLETHNAGASWTPKQ